MKKIAVLFAVLAGWGSPSALGELPPEAAVKGLITALGQCDVEKSAYVMNEYGIGPNTIIGYHKKQPRTPFYISLKAFPKIWGGVRPGTKDLSGKKGYIKDEFGNYRSRKLQAKMDLCMSVVRKMLEAGADVNGPGLTKSGAIAVAWSSRWPDLLMLLAEHGADPYQYNPFGSISLHGNSTRTHPRFFPNGRCDRNVTICAKNVLDTEILMWLITNATPEQINLVHKKTGGTPISGAVRFAMSSVPEKKMLKRMDVWLAAGANPCLKDKDGQNAAD
ncbi:MAG: hypothetical protein AAF438_20030, partial [Pseudomonadota bacterium]